MSIGRRRNSLLNKAIAAAVSAIEIYNKPDFKYREETFAILMVNAWEILLKAKILSDSSGDLRSIYVQKRKTKIDGTPLKRFYPEINRTGNPKTIDIFSALNKLPCDDVLKENIRLLVDIRDNAIHLMNKEKLIEKKVLEIGTANLKSFVTVISEWFDHSLDDYNFYLMPISFYHPYEFESFSLSSLDKQMQNILLFISQKETEYPSKISNTHNITLKLETKFVKGSGNEALKIKYSNDPDTLAVKITEEQVFKGKYPLDYVTLCEQARNRYQNFKLSKKFHDLKRVLCTNDKYARTKYLDPDNKKSAHQTFYSTEIFKELDKHYRKRKVSKAIVKELFK